MSNALAQELRTYADYRATQDDLSRVLFKAAEEVERTSALHSELLRDRTFVVDMIQMMKALKLTDTIQFDVAERRLEGINTALAKTTPNPTPAGCLLPVRK